MSAKTLDAFAFGDTAAAALGVHVGRSRALLLTATALLTGALVAVSGSIGFVGLILPHGVRLLVGSRHRALLPLSALAGAIFLVWVDTGARTLFDPRELPVGILTALIGGPVFAAAPPAEPETAMTDARSVDGLRVDRVRFTRGNRLIIDDLDCTVPAGCGRCTARVRTVRARARCCT